MLRYIVKDDPLGEEESIGHDRDVIFAAGGYLGEGALANFLKERSNPLNRNRYIHNKFMLVDPLSEDPLVVTGSANFSKPSQRTNDENMLIIAATPAWRTSTSANSCVSSTTTTRDTSCVSSPMKDAPTQRPATSKRKPPTGYRHTSILQATSQSGGNTLRRRRSDHGPGSIDLRGRRTGSGKSRRSRVRCSVIRTTTSWSTAAEIGQLSASKIQQWGHSGTPDIYSNWPLQVLLCFGTAPS